MEYLSLLFFVLTLSFSFFMDYKVKHPFLMIWLYNIPFVVLPGIYAVYNSTYPSSTINGFFLFAAFCQLVYCFLALLLPQHNNSFIVKDVTLNSELKLVAPICFYIPLILTVILILLNYPNLVKSRGGSLQIIYAYSIMYLVGFWYFYKSKSKVYTFLIILILLFQILVFKSRGSFAYIVMPFVFFSICRGLNFKALIWLALISVSLLSLVIMLKSYRWASNSGAVDVELLSSGFMYIMSVLFTKGELALINHSFFVYEICTGNSPICGQATLIDKLFASRISDYNVEGAAYQIWDRVTGQIGVGGSLHSLSYGVAFFDLKYLGVFYFVALALLRALISFILPVSYGLLVIGPLMYFCLFFSRGSVYNSLVPLVVSLIIFMLFYLFFYFFKKKAR